ncbi:hypothetical protein QR680_007223 [Steinernema hermaphroditum]|uniref:Uncharacterized protein n=1 Tax=Steinernema hermaphroditum TaxID=289476 RepID=A0AA39HZS1_9BILA|nr:hypothetical protein QR680_007223 [Steinernema hermaphroditum]
MNSTRSSFISLPISFISLKAFNKALLIFSSVLRKTMNESANEVTRVVQSDLKEITKNMLALKAHRQARLTALKILVEGQLLHNEYGIRDSMKRALSIDDMKSQERQLQELQNQLNTLNYSLREVDEVAVKRSEECAAQVAEHQKQMAELMAVLQANNLSYDEFAKYLDEKSRNARDEVAEELAKVQAEEEKWCQACAKLKEAMKDAAENM